MDIRLFDTRLEVAMNLGDFNTLLVSPARSQLNDGAWHHVRVSRSLSSLLVEIDDGAGPGLAAFLPLDATSNYLKMSIGKKVSNFYFRYLFNITATVCDSINSNYPSDGAVSSPSLHLNLPCAQNDCLM